MPIWLLTFLSYCDMTHDCFLEIGGWGKRRKFFNKKTPGTKQRFTFVVVKKKSHFTDKM